MARNSAQDSLRTPALPACRTTAVENSYSRAATPDCPGFYVFDIMDSRKNGTIIALL
jgi:hypothetical protein